MEWRARNPIGKTAITVALLITSLTLAAWIGSVSATAVVSKQALELSDINRGITGLAATHNLLGDILALAPQQQLGLIDAATWFEAIDGSRTSLRALNSVAEESVSEYQMTATRFLDRISDGAFTLAGEEWAEVQRSFDTSLDALDARRATIELEVNSGGTSAMALSTAAGLALGLVLPLAAVLIYRARSRRTVRTESAMARLKAQHQLQNDRETLIAGISHELRTPLTGIAGFVDLLQSDAVDRSEAMELIDIVATEAGDITRKLDDLTAMSRLSFGTLEFIFTTIDISSAIEDALLAVELNNVDLDLDPEAFAVADPKRTHHVLRNLFQNAKQHGGSQVQVCSFVTDTSIRIRVVDDGTGIDADVDRIFDPYANHDSALLKGSIGLGLAVAQGMATAMHGELSYERDSESTTFTLTLPRSHVPAKAIS